MDWVQLLGPTLLAALVGLTIWFIQSRIEQLRAAQARLHDDRRRIYLEVLDPYIRILNATKTGQGNEKAVRRLLSPEHRKVAFELVMVGSDEVVEKFNAFMQWAFHAEETGDQDPNEMMRRRGRLLLAIRRNIGDPRTELDEIDMLRSWFRDADTLRAEAVDVGLIPRLFRRRTNGG